MLRAATAIAMATTILVLFANEAPAVTREGCAAEGGTVEHSGRGTDWWKCCLKVPSGILRRDRTKICFVCSGDSPDSNCDQVPYVSKKEENAAKVPAADDKKKSK